MSQGSALYAYVLSSLLAKTTFAELKLEKHRVNQPLFYDESHLGPQTFDNLPNVQWFNASVLGEKALNLKSGGLADCMDVEADPDNRFTFADYCRQQLAQRYFLPTTWNKHVPIINEVGKVELAVIEVKTNFIGLSLDTILSKLKVDNIGKAMRRGAAGHCKSREFALLIDSAKSENNYNALHLPAEAGSYTPLHLALRNQQAKKAAMLLTAHHFNLEELSAKNKDKKNAYDYFEKTNSQSLIRQNPVLRQFLKR
jgi:hypothetical protein